MPKVLCRFEGDYFDSAQFYSGGAHGTIHNVAPLHNTRGELIEPSSIEGIQDMAPDNEAGREGV
jgi:hypothetical protein